MTISYWGIDHGSVSKAYLGGGRWVPAVQAGAKQMRAARGAHAAAKGRSAMDQQWLDNISRLDSQIKGLTKPIVRRRRTVTAPNGHKVARTDVRAQPATGMDAFAYMSGKNSRNIMVGPTASKKQARMITQHEMAHLSPKNRTAYRLGQITRDNTKTMREEARADMAAGQYWRKKPRSLDELTDGSGYALAARSPRSARHLYTAQRSGRLEAMRSFKATGDNEALAAARSVPKRERMFTKRPLAAYRHTQDRIAGAQNMPRRSGKKNYAQQRDAKMDERAWNNTRTTNGTNIPINPRRLYVDSSYKRVNPAAPKKSFRDRMMRR